MDLIEMDKKKYEVNKYLHGFTSEDSSFFDTKEFNELRRVFLNYLPKNEEEKIENTLVTKKEVLRFGQDLIKRHFASVDLDVPFTSDDGLSSELVAIYGKKPTKEQYDDIIKYIKKEIEYVKATDIPVVLDISKITNGGTQYTYLYDPAIMEIDYFKKLPIITNKIDIMGPCTNESKYIYVHELGHALIGKNKGSIENVYNNESFSIFMEKLAAYEDNKNEKALDIKNYLRLLQTKTQILKCELSKYNNDNSLIFETRKSYIYSLLNATSLFEIYKNGSERVKREIIKSLSNTLNGNNTLETTFDKFYVSPADGTEIVKKQIKKYHRYYQS